MTRTEQMEFVRELSTHVAEGIVGSIVRGDIPADWDGKELRLLLAEKHSSWRSFNTVALVRRYRAFMRTHNV